MSGMPIVTALSIETGVKTAFVRKKAKDYGTCKLAEGAEISNKNICVIEDVVTTGGQIIESVREIRQRGVKIHTVLCVILSIACLIFSSYSCNRLLFHSATKQIALQGA